MQNEKNEDNVNSKLNETTLSSQEEERIDNVVASTIRGLDILTAKANGAGIGTIARILHNAKEDLVYWAVELDFHETAKEKFINYIMYNNAVFVASDFIAKLNMVKDNKIFAKGQKNNDLEKPSFAIMDNLRDLELLIE